MPRRTAALAAVAAMAAAVWLWASVERGAASGFVLQLSPHGGGPERVVRTFDLDPIRARRLSPALPASARWTGWLLSDEESLELIVATGSATVVRVDGAVALSHDGRPRRLTAPLHLSAGLHEIVVEHELGPQEADLRVAVASAEGPPERLDTRRVLGSPRVPATEAVRPWAGLVAIVSVCGLLAAWWPRLRAATPGTRLRLAHMGAVAITLYGALLRIEALALKYDAPEWMSAVVPIAQDLHPRGMKWLPPEHPYQGDPFSYLRLARDMRWFYEASVREPVFVFATSQMLHASDAGDVAVSMASGLSSTLLVPATYLLGLAAFSPPVGLVAAAAIAVERQVIGLGVDGWRDDTFALFLVLSAAALLRLRDRPTWTNSSVSGLAMGAALLTRITALSFIVPALAIIALAGEGPRRERWRRAAAAGLLAVLLLAPFLVTCALEFGDPLHSINAHTRFYRSRAAGSHEAATGWHTMLSERGGLLTLADTGLIGVTTYPFTSKWQHFDYLAPWIGPLLAWAAVAGLALWALAPPGRLLLVVLLSSLLPFAFTWDVPGGSERRFTLHAYPFYLLAAASAPGLAAFTARYWRPHARVLVFAAVAAPVAYLAACALAYGRVREEIGAGRESRVAVGARDLFFFGEGWSWPRRSGHVRLRRGAPTGADMRLPLRAGRPYRLVLRVDPEAASTRAMASLNGTAIGELPLARDDRRIGRYELDVAPAVARDGANTLRLEAGAPFHLWLIHVEPR